MQTISDPQAASPAIRIPREPSAGLERLEATADAVRRPLGPIGSSAVRRPSRRPVLALAAVAASALAAFGAPVSGVQSPATAVADGTSDGLLFGRVNQDRTSNGVAAVQYYQPLADIAERANYGGCGFNVRGRAQDMIDRDYFAHPILGCGQYVFSMMKAAGIPYQFAGENIGWNTYGDPAQAVSQIDASFMNSPEHRSIILNPRLTHVGIGSASSGGSSWGGGGGSYQNASIFTEEFAQLPGVPGSPAPAAPLQAIDSSPLAHGAAAVVGTDHQPYSFGSSGFVALGGRTIAAPAVAVLPDRTLYVVNGEDHSLWLRSDTQGWQHAAGGPDWCQDSPAASVSGGQLVIACIGSDGSLWASWGDVPRSGLPVVGDFVNLGGRLTAGPAIASVNGVVTFAVAGVGGRVWLRTLRGGWAPTGWVCTGHPALGDSDGTAYFGCDGTDRALWTAFNTGAGWSAAQSMGGPAVGGVGVAPQGAAGARYFVIGVTGDMWQVTVSTDGGHSFVRRGGSVVGGAGAAGY